MKRISIFLVGPTASGKSKLALALARKIKGEIISCDAMQIYQKMDIGTAKPTPGERQLVPHHLIGLISPRSEYSVFKYRKLALDTMEKIFTRNRIPIVVGGSGLYLKAIRDGLAPQPGRQISFRRRLEQVARQKGLRVLYEKLEKIDPKRARAIHPNDKRRIIRALEIFELSRRMPSEWCPETEGLEARGIRFLTFGLLRDRSELYGRIERRVDQMFAQGWTQEVKRLKRIGLSKTARAAIGYHEILQYLQSKGDFGKGDLEEIKCEIKKRTRHLAKKQMTWFRRDQQIRWFLVSGNRFVSKTLRQIMSQLKSKGFLSDSR
ncbi:MAG: tRNA (adenosine(37)-N6)-dimethylallyltransferase MiaA [Candidatus Omnitrophica bacterium]|nr:tRNA (adenosine(37)-N6)-dimethylallyltransferase MiaA [Candidatus Omnitrophota bacterium]